MDDRRYGIDVPCVVADGKLIACFAAPDANAAYNKSVAGTTERVIMPNGKVEERTVPDSNMSLDGHTAHPYLQQRKTWLLDPSGTAAPHQLTSEPPYRHEEPLWSADGGHILFGRMDFDGNRSLWLMDSSGGNATQVCTLPAEDTSWFGFYGYIDWRASFDWLR